MAVITQEIPSGETYYDPATGTVKQDTGQWQIMTDTQTKIFTIDPDATVNKTAWSDPGFSAPRVRVGFTHGAALLIAWLSNHPPG